MSFWYKTNKRLENQIVYINREDIKPKKHQSMERTPKDLINLLFSEQKPLQKNDELYFSDIALSTYGRNRSEWTIEPAKVILYPVVQLFFVGFFISHIHHFSTEIQGE